ncbi:helix-turn-helix domain-containing protein [Streptomyces sp. NPDC050355]|uniref:helix-turn-helix domain-containing protein n=1 Tax=Streptomyces sp. NPDC050355 TaxID=3365609 RepID=UPI003799EE45
MRYAQGGGLGPHEQAERERIRMLAAEGFDRGEKNTAIAKGLRVSVRSVERWRRSWRDNGIAVPGKCCARKCASNNSGCARPWRGRWFGELRTVCDHFIAFCAS